MPPLESNLVALRKKVEEINDKILDYLVQRFEATEKIQKIKKKLHLGKTQPKREAEVIHHSIAHVEQKLKKKLSRADKIFIKRLFFLIFSYAKKTGIINRWKHLPKKQTR